jgi:hypothetical protein
MQIEQTVIRDTEGLNGVSPASRLQDAQLVITFGDPGILENGDLTARLRSRYPIAEIVFCSSGGEIAGDRVLDGAAVTTAIRFKSVQVRAASEPIASAADSEAAARRLAGKLSAEGLRHVLVFAEGLHVNGSAVSSGLTDALPRGVSVTGGLAADAARFKRTLVGLNETPTTGQLVAIALYGERLRIGMGSLGGWEMFGPERRITRSEGNVLYELDGKSALGIYREVLGRKAYGLPATGLLYPLNVRLGSDGPGLVRTILAIDEDSGSVTFAGDVPEGSYARMMRADLDTLIHAAAGAAGRAGHIGDAKPELVLLVSCIGRKLVLQMRTEEEVLAAREIFGRDAHFAGFYSYGEISPLTPTAACELHNQTMTITTFSESD